METKSQSGMGIFDLSTKKTAYQTTEGFDFGKTESEGEVSYKSSSNSPFDDFLKVLPQIQNGYFLITGRKGAGKSAIAKYIKDNSIARDGIFCEIVKTDVLDLERQIQESLAGRTEYIVSFFQWIILVKLVKMMLESQSDTYTNEMKALHNFVRNNRGVVDVDKFSIAEISTLSKAEINIGALSNNIVFNAILERVIGKKLVRAPFYRLLPALKEIVYKALSFDVFKGMQLFVVFDDLDINFKAYSETDKTYLLNLIRTAKEINNDLRELQNTFILIFLRDDIKHSLEGFAADTNKIFSSYEVELKWYDHFNYKNRETDTVLRRFINKRIENNFKKIGIPYQAADPWQSLFANTDSCYGNKTAFKFILDYTFYRPRDLIIFCNNIGKDKYYYPIKGPNIKSLIQKYTCENIKELKDELTIHCSQEQVNDIFSILKDLLSSQYSGFLLSDIILKLENKSIDKSIADLLVEYSFIIPYDVNTGKYYIKYREADYSDFSSCNIKYRLHNCIYAYYVPESIKLSD